METLESILLQDVYLGQAKRIDWGQEWMMHFSISVSPQCFHLPICLSSVYFLSLSPCLSVVYGVWEMRHFANGTSQVNLKFRFFFLMWLFDKLCGSNGVCSFSPAWLLACCQPQALREFGAVFLPSLTCLLWYWDASSIDWGSLVCLSTPERGMEQHSSKCVGPKALTVSS